MPTSLTTTESWIRPGGRRARENQEERHTRLTLVGTNPRHKRRCMTTAKLRPKNINLVIWIHRDSRPRHCCIFPVPVLPIVTYCLEEIHVSSLVYLWGCFRFACSVRLPLFACVGLCSSAAGRRVLMAESAPRRGAFR